MTEHLRKLRNSLAKIKDGYNTEINKQTDDIKRVQKAFVYHAERKKNLKSKPKESVEDKTERIKTKKSELKILINGKK